MNTDLIFGFITVLLLSASYLVIYVKEYSSRPTVRKDMIIMIMHGLY